MRYFITTILLVLLAGSLSSQVMLQLERRNSLKVKRYHPGDILRFKTKEYKEWQSGEIVQILPEAKSLVFADRITYLRDITHVSYDRRWAKVGGTKLTQFGIVWLSLAGISELAKKAGVLRSNYDAGPDTIAIGVWAIATGLILKKGFGIARKRINKRNRVRIIDLSF